MGSTKSLIELLQSATEAFHRRSFAEVEKLCLDVLNRFGEEANALLMLGLVYSAQGNALRCIEYLERARRKNPGHIHVLSNLGSMYRQMGRYDEAKSALLAAIQIDARFAPALNNLGNVFFDLEQREEAQRCYEKVIAVNANSADALANLGRMAEEAHHLDQAEDFAQRALNAVPGHLQARLTFARVLQRKGDPISAGISLEALLSLPSLPPKLRISAHGYLGECFDSQERFGEAFHQFEAANDLQFGMLDSSYGKTGYLVPHRVDQLTAFVEQQDFSSWSPGPACDRSPVFLVGFPRSGTTLLDQVLSSHPQVVVQEERDALTDVCSELMTENGNFSFWADLAPHQIERLRGRYWARARAGTSESNAHVFVDKLPLNAILLPVIFRLFQTAKIILALRDPRDCVLSCFQQRFGMNAAMYQMLRLDTAASYYSKVMSLVDLCDRKLPLSIHKVRYEDVVSNFDAEIGKLLEFLDLSWNDGVRGYAETARTRYVNTPSATQVVQPLYTSSMRKWRNYRDHMVEIFPVLAPWVAAFGYEP